MADDQSLADRHYLLRAIALSAGQVTSGRGGPFGAVVVRDGVIIAEGCNEVTSAFDPTAHAEVVAIRRACSSLRDFSLAGATIYASCEPCPMCLAAIYWARLDRRLPTLHPPLREGLDAFSAWARKPDKIAY